MASKGQPQPQTQRIAAHAAFFMVLLVFVLLAALHSLIVPLTQGEDELAHYRYLGFIAQTGRLPINQAERRQAWYRSDWPPLYHLLVGWAVSPLDTTRPHLKDVGESPRRRLVGEIFYPRLIIYTEDANWPWQDGILAWHWGRFISIVLAAGALVFTYLTALELARHLQPAGGVSPPLFAAAVTALLAFTPRFLFTSAMLSDDSLLVLLSAMFIWLLLRAMRGVDSWWLYAAMGLLLGLSLATKYSTGLLPLTLIPLVWRRAVLAGWRWSAAVGRMLWNWLFTILGVSWWFGWIIYYFNTVSRDGWLFGLLSPVLASGPDVSMRRVFALFGGGNYTGPLRPGAVSEGTFAGWWAYLFHTFWGVPVLEHDPLWPWLYLPVLLFCALALVGLWRYWRDAANGNARPAVGLLILLVALLLPFPVLRFFLTYNILETGQGRHILYPAAQSIPILLLIGWLQFGQITRQRLTHRHALAFFPAFALLLWSGWQLIYMARVYPAPLPVQTTTFNPAGIPQPLRHQFSPEIELLGYDYQPDPAQSRLNLTLFWRALAPVDENYRVQAQLTDSAGQPRFTWLSHPLDGRYPTRAWDAGDVVRDALPLPLAALPPGTYQIQINLRREADDATLGRPFQIVQFELPQSPPIANASVLGGVNYRLWLADSTVRARQTIALSFQNSNPAAKNPGWALLGPDNQPRPPAAIGDATAVFIVGPEWPGGGYRLALSTSETTAQPVLTVANSARLFDVPPELAARPGWTPTNANFAGQIELLGYALPQRRAEPGGALPVSLAWRSLAPVQPDAVTFAVLLNANQQPYGSVDRYPGGFYSPMLWATGEVALDEFALPVSPAAPPGVYTLHLGQYIRQTDGALNYLSLLDNDRPTKTTAVVAGPIKIGGPPPEVVTTNPQPQRLVNQLFGGQITLLGYDIDKAESNNSQNSPNSLTLTLYWRAETAPAADYTTFLHLRNAAGQTVAQKDQPPAAGRYPTSLWDAGEVVADELVLPLDRLAPGEYTPVVGLYQLADGARLAVPGQPANEIALKPVLLGQQ